MLINSKVIQTNKNHTPICKETRTLSNCQVQSNSNHELYAYKSILFYMCLLILEEDKSISFWFGSIHEGNEYRE